MRYTVFPGIVPQIWLRLYFPGEFLFYFFQARQSGNSLLSFCCAGNPPSSLPSSVLSCIQGTHCRRLLCPRLLLGPLTPALCAAVITRAIVFPTSDVDFTHLLSSPFTAATTPGQLFSLPFCFWYQPSPLGMSQDKAGSATKTNDLIFRLCSPQSLILTHTSSCTGQLVLCTPQDNQGPGCRQLHCHAGAPEVRWHLALLCSSLAERPWAKTNPAAPPHCKEAGNALLTELKLFCVEKQRHSQVLSPGGHWDGCLPSAPAQRTSGPAAFLPPVSLPGLGHPPKGPTGLLSEVGRATHHHWLPHAPP